MFIVEKKENPSQFVLSTFKEVCKETLLFDMISSYENVHKTSVYDLTTVGIAYETKISKPCHALMKTN